MTFLIASLEQSRYARAIRRNDFRAKILKRQPFGPQARRLKSVFGDMFCTCFRPSTGAYPNLKILEARQAEEEINPGSQQGGDRASENPGSDHVARDTPTHSRESLARANAHDGPGDGVRGADRQTQKAGGDDRGG